MASRTPRSTQNIELIVPRDMVEQGDPAVILQHLSILSASPDMARKCQGLLDLRFAGYDGDGEELFEIPDVRSFVQKLDVEFPYWLYYMSKETNALQAVILSFLPPFLTSEAKAVEFPKHLEQLLTRRWIPALNAIGAFAGLRDDEVDHLTDQAVDYIISGPGQ